MVQLRVSGQLEVAVKAYDGGMVDDTQGIEVGLCQMRAHLGLDFILCQQGIHVNRTAQQLVLALGVEHYVIAFDGGVGLNAVYLPLVVADAMQLYVGHHVTATRAVG